MRRAARALLPRNGARRAAELILETALPRKFPDFRPRFLPASAPETSEVYDAPPA